MVTFLMVLEMMNTTMTNLMGPQPYHCRGRYQDRLYRIPSPRRDQGYPRNQIHEDPYDVTRKVKVDVPNFDGGHDLNAFVDWLDCLEDSFEFYIMNDIHRVCFAKMKLIGCAKKY